MYFITKPKPGTVLMGVYNNCVYSFGKKSGTLRIYKKSIFNTGDWEEFCDTQIEVYKSNCITCFKGLEAAATIINGNIWILGNATVSF